MSYRYIIHKILKEERVEEGTLVRLLSRYQEWDEKLSQLSIAADYSEIIEKHFRSGLILLIDMRSLVKKEPIVVEKELKLKMGDLGKKLNTIDMARKTLDSLR